MKKISILLFSLVCLALTNVNGQDYQTAIGAKFYSGGGTSGGLNIKHSLTGNTALEGSLLFGHSVALEGLYELQGGIPGAGGLQYFVGGGAMLDFGNNHNGTSFGIRLTGGVEYTFNEIPINVSLGLDPIFRLAPSTESDLWLGLAFRYTLR
ncbi:MAG: hypothetical protein J5I50_02150 [Chitinophagaceae bacterium]|nr:hypothetical protein [Chitinophagaceae bacterium]